MMASDRRLHANKAVRDIGTGDFVRRVGHPGVGLVESITNDGYAWIGWKSGLSELLPLPVLRRVAAGGHDLDAKRSQP